MNRDRELSKSFDMPEELELSLGAMGEWELSRVALPNPMNSGFELQPAYPPVGYSANHFLGFWDQHQQGSDDPNRAQYFGKPTSPYTGQHYYAPPPPAPRLDASTVAVLGHSHAPTQNAAPTRIVGELVPFVGHDPSGRVPARPYLAVANSQWASFDAAHPDARQDYRYSYRNCASPRGRYLSPNRERAAHSFGRGSIHSPGPFQPYQHYNPIRATAPDVSRTMPFPSGGPTSPRRQPHQQTCNKEPVYSLRMLDTVGLCALSLRSSPSRFSNPSRTSPSDSTSLPPPASERQQNHVKAAQPRTHNSSDRQQQRQQQPEFQTRARVEEELSHQTQTEKMANDVRRGSGNGPVVQRIHSSGGSSPSPEQSARVSVLEGARDRALSSSAGVACVMDRGGGGAAAGATMSQQSAQRRTSWLQSVAQSKTIAECALPAADARRLQLENVAGLTARSSTMLPIAIASESESTSYSARAPGPLQKQHPNGQTPALTPTETVENTQSHGRATVEAREVSSKNDVSPVGGNSRPTEIIISASASVSQSRPQTPRASGKVPKEKEKEESWLGLSGLGGVSRFLEQLLAPAPATDPAGNASESTAATATTPPPYRSGATNGEKGEVVFAGEAATGRANGQPANSTQGSQNTARTTNEQDSAMGPRRYSLQTEDSCEKLVQCAQASGRRRAPIKVLYSRALGVDKAVQTLPSDVDPSASEHTIKLYSQEDLVIALKKQRAQFEENMAKMKAKYEMENFESKDRYLMKLVNAREKIEALEQQLERAHILVGLESLTREAHSSTPDAEPEASYSSGGSASARSDQLQSRTEIRDGCRLMGLEGGRAGVCGKGRDPRGGGGGSGSSRGPRNSGCNGGGFDGASGELESCASENDLRRAAFRRAGSACDEAIAEEPGALTKCAPGGDPVRSQAGGGVSQVGAATNEAGTPNRATMRARPVDSTGLAPAAPRSTTATAALRAPLPKQHSMDSSPVHPNSKHSS